MHLESTSTIPEGVLPSAQAGEDGRLTTPCGTTPPISSEPLTSSQIGLGELVELCAVDDELYGRTFFPNTVRQASPDFHREIDAALNGPDRLVSIMVFRDGAKTTKLRLFASKKIAYGVSRTILIVGKSEGQAVRTLEWLQRAVEYNPLWAQTFALRKGKKWSGSEIEIFHGVDEVPIRVIALGITGSTRGINVDDYRPDLIIIDDPSDEENTATPEQREKTDDFINGSLRNSLAPSSEAPHAKMVFLQTLLHPEDSIAKCATDPAWKFLKFSVFTDDGQSRWPARWTKEQLVKDKESYIARGKLHLWMREKECTIISSELAVFRPQGLQYWDILPEKMTTFLAIDPVPPPSERELATGLRGKDWEVLAVVGRWRGRFYLCEYTMNRGHDPEWTVMKFFELKERWNVLKCRVESIAYQRTLKWLLEKAMQKRRQWLQMEDTSTDRRKKTYRIIDIIGSASAEAKLFCNKSHTEFVEQYLQYPNVVHDDVIDAVSLAIAAAQSGGVYEGDYESLEEDESEIPELVYAGNCP